MVDVYNKLTTDTPSEDLVLKLSLLKIKIDNKKTDLLNKLESFIDENTYFSANETLDKNKKELNSNLDNLKLFFKNLGKKKDKLVETVNKNTEINEIINKKEKSLIEKIYNNVEKTSELLINKINNQQKYFGSFKKYNVIISQRFLSISNSVLKISKTLLSLDGFNSWAKSFDRFWDRTIGSFFNKLSSRLPSLKIFFKTVEYIFDGIKWLGKIGVGLLGFIYDKFVWLAKIGWKAITSVFEFVSNRVKDAVGIFSDIALDILSSPAIFFAGGIFLYLYKDEIKSYLENAFGGIYDTTVSALKNVWNTIEQSELGKLFKNIWGQTVELYNKTLGKYFTKEYLIKFYDDNLSSIVGYKFSDIQGIYKNVSSKFKNYFDEVINFIEFLKDSNVFDELIMLWNVILRLVMSKEQYTKTKLISENKKRFDKVFQDQVKKKVESFIKLNLLNRVTQDDQYSFLSQEDLERDLKSYKNLLYEQVKNSFKDEEIKDLIDDLNLDFSPFISEISNRIDNIPYLNSLKPEEEVALNSTDKIIDLLTKELKTSKIYDDPERFAYILDKLLPKIYELQESDYKNFENAFDYMKSNTSAAQKAVEKSVLMLEEAWKNNILNMGLKQESINSVLDKINEELRLLYIGKITKSDFNKNILEIQKSDEIISRIPETEYGNKFNFFQIPEMAEGGVVTDKINAIIGEGDSPEIVIPLNKSGVEFIENLMNDLDKESIEHESKLQENGNSGSIIHKIIKNKKSTGRSKTLYDMKNISHGVIGF